MRVDFAGPIIALLLIVTGCTQAPTPAPDMRAADEQAIRDLEAEWAKAYAAKDVDRLVSFYADDATLFPQGEPAASNSTAIRASLEKMVSVPGFSLNFETGKVDVARSGDLAYTQGTYSMSMTGPKGASMTEKGKYVTVYRKEGGGAWKAVADIFNSDQPASVAASK